MRVLRLCVGCFLAACGLAAVADPDYYRGRPIVEVRFEPARQPTSAARLRELMQIPLKSPLEPTLIRAAIKKLYASGL